MYIYIYIYIYTTINKSYSLYAIQTLRLDIYSRYTTDLRVLLLKIACLGGLG